MQLRRRPWQGLLYLVLAALVLVGCSQQTVPQTTFDPGGPVARIQADLMMLQIVVVSFIFVVVFGLLIYIVFRFRNRGERRLPAQIHGNPKLEIMWTVIPIILLVIMAVPTVQAAFALDPDYNAEVAENALLVEVEGKQWFWNFSYPSLDINTSNELHIPAGQKVLLHLKGAEKDVVHSFWVPVLGGKTDVIPGRVTKMWLEADKPGVYFGQCAEFCGTSHANMRFRVIAHEQADFDNWVATRQSPTIDVAADALTAGTELFQKKGCAGCHTIDGTEFKGEVGPNLTGLSTRTTLGAGILDNTEENLRAWVQNAPSLKPGSIMPKISLKPEELDALITFLQGLK